MSKHRPGQWRIIDHGAINSLRSVEVQDSANRQTIVMCQGSRALANACMIAAAPEMFEVLKQIEQSVLPDTLSYLIDRAEKAINKAEGKS